MSGLPEDLHDRLVVLLSVLTASPPDQIIIGARPAAHGRGWVAFGARGGHELRSAPGNNATDALARLEEVVVKDAIGMQQNLTRLIEAWQRRTRPEPPAPAPAPVPVHRIPIEAVVLEDD